MKVFDEINKFATEEDKPILIWLFNRYHWASQWQFVASCKFVKYGTLSYQSNRVWYPTPEGRTLFNHFDNDHSTPPEDVI